MIIVHTPFTARKRDHIKSARPIRGKSIVVEEQTMSLRQIVERYVNKQPFPGGSRELSYDDPDFDGLGVHPNTLDISERAEMLQEANKRIREFEDSENQKRSQEEKELLKQQIKAELEAEERQRALSGEGNPEA